MYVLYSCHKRKDVYIYTYAHVLTVFSKTLTSIIKGPGSKFRSNLAITVCLLFGIYDIWDILASGNQTWRPGKSPMNGGLNGKISYKRLVFQQAMFEYRRVYTLCNSEIHHPMFLRLDYPTYHVWFTFTYIHIHTYTYRYTSYTYLYIYICLSISAEFIIQHFMMWNSRWNASCSDFASFWSSVNSVATTYPAVDIMFIPWYTIIAAILGGINLHDCSWQYTDYVLCADIFWCIVQPFWLGWWSQVMFISFGFDTSSHWEKPTTLWDAAEFRVARFEAANSVLWIWNHWFMARFCTNNNMTLWVNKKLWKNLWESHRKTIRKQWENGGLPSDNRLQKSVEHHHVSWVNPTISTGPFSSSRSVTVITRGSYPSKYPSIIPMIIPI